MMSGDRIRWHESRLDAIEAFGATPTLPLIDLHLANGQVQAYQSAANAILDELAVAPSGRDRATAARARAAIACLDAISGELTASFRGHGPGEDQEEEERQRRLEEDDAEDRWNNPEKDEEERVLPRGDDD